MIHQFKNNGIFIVLDVNSGAVHVVDELVYEMLSLLDDDIEYLSPKCPSSIAHSLEHYGSDTVNEAYGEIYELYKSGLLFSKTITHSSPTKW